MFKWSWDFNTKFEPKTAHVWLRFPLLPISFCFKGYLREIVVGLGECISIDLPTPMHTRHSYARVYAEMDLLSPREETIWIGTRSGKGFLQKVIYEDPLNIVGAN